VAVAHDAADLPVLGRAEAVRSLFRDHESALLQPLLDFMAQHPRVRMIGKDRAALRAPTVAFSVDGWNSAELGRKLVEKKLGVGVGHFYAYRLVEALGYDTDEGVLRASFVHYTRPAEITRMIEALDELL
jgi:selenocysteine lyase/cysteine desulfurase